ncbi:MAG: hypothetical protein IKU83_00510 [Lachnospiraceae bacterium]|nr:hypothetical protein [Lachnospiraceae bacterium]
MKNKYIIFICIIGIVCFVALSGMWDTKSRLVLPTDSISIKYDFGTRAGSIVVDDVEELQVVNESLSSWDLKMYRHELRDEACEIEICFDTGAVIYISRSENYGRIEGDDRFGYCFPERFLIWLRSIMAENE